MITFLEKIRQSRGFSQEFLAEKLGVSRPTLQKILSGEKELTLTQARKTSELFEISLQALLNEKDETDIEVHLQESAHQPEEKPTIRISIPQESVEKFKQVLLYITEKVGALPNVGQTVLYKLLYFCDFDYYEKFEEQLIGAKYIKNHYGPTPVAFRRIVDDMVNNGEIEEVKTKYFDHDQTKYLPVKKANLAGLSAREIQHIDEVLNRLANKSATELSDLSHKDVPWITAEEGKEVDYEAVFYRTPETSVRQYKDELQ